MLYLGKWSEVSNDLWVFKDSMCDQVLKSKIL